MNDEERKLLGDMVRIQRQMSFGTKSNAYREADVNAATWDRVEAGQKVREDRLVAVVKTLWPSSGGD